jgi:hypothetical protein
MHKLKYRNTVKKLYLIILSLIILVSCQPADTEKNIIIENRYSISIPSFLTKVSNLNEEASLQYQHALKEFYVIVIDEPKEEMQKALTAYDLTDIYTNNVHGYTNLFLDNFEQVISVSKKSDVIDTLINSMPARVFNIIGRVEGIDAYYSLAIIEGEKSYYQVMAWTLSNKEVQYKENMNRILYSLKEL